MRSGNSKLEVLPAVCRSRKKDIQYSGLERKGELLPEGATEKKYLSTTSRSAIASSTPEEVSFVALWTRRETRTLAATIALKAPFLRFAIP